MLSHHRRCKTSLAPVLYCLLTSIASRSVAAETIASSSSPASSHAHIHRHLAGLTLHPRFRHDDVSDVCVATSATDFAEDTLGPSNELTSLYNTAALSYQLTSTASGTASNVALVQEELYVPIGSLAGNLMWGLLIGAISGVDPVPFVQDEQSFGLDGQYTEELISQHALLAKFWKTTDKGQPPLLLVALHADILRDYLEVAILLWLYVTDYISLIDVADTDLTLAATQVQVAIETELPDGYSNPNLSFDAFFGPNLGIPGMETTSAIFMGDGFLAFGDYLGFDAVVNDYTHAHEFGHWVQYIMDLEDSGNDLAVLEDLSLNSTPEENRQGELEADAMAAYALAHEQGRNFDVALLVQATKLAFAVGDCTTDDKDHHGTPKQRECAVKWGADEGLDMTGDPVSMREFRALFLANVDGILNLDPSVCTLTDDTNSSTGKPDMTPSSPTAEPSTPDTSGAAMVVSQLASFSLVAGSACTLLLFM
jgi:hypothetical protein